MSGGVVCFGELLLRLDTKGHDRFVQAQEFRARYSGAEANVAVSLSGFGRETFAVSRVPAHEIGQACLDALRRYGVNVGGVARGGERLGLLYVEAGSGQRPSKVIYDRGGSSFAEARPEEFDWERILAGKEWFHFAGTAPARGPNIVRILEEALRAARRLGVTVSCDPNYRAKLWSPEQAGATLGPLLEMTDIFLGGGEDAGKLFGIQAGEGLPPEEAAAARAEALIRRFGFRCAAVTLRSGTSASAGSIAGLLRGRAGTYRSRRYELSVVDRIGGGDAFAAGVIHALLSGWDGARTIEFATAAASLKHTIPGDFNLVSAEEVEALAAGGDGSRVSR
jgi:2-dehydro-3-deoxygluconokinase